MAVNSTSSTAMAPMTSFARRDSVGTGTGGRMATSGLLQFSVGQMWFVSPVPARTTLRGASGSPSSQTDSFLPARYPSAGGRGAPCLEVRQGLECVVQAGHLGQGKAVVGCGFGLGAVVGGNEEQLSEIGRAH